MKDLERWKTARPEAGHAVAALHYDCPIECVSIEVQWPGLGTTRLGISKTSDSVVIFCGPLAEKDWDEFRPGANVHFPPPVGGDLEVLEYLKESLNMTRDEFSSYYAEAVDFMCIGEVQQQIDRLALVLFDRGQLAAEDVCAAVGFTVSRRQPG